MTFENDRPIPGGDDHGSTRSENSASPDERTGAGDTSSIGPAPGERFELGIEEVGATSADAPEDECSRVDGMPEGWLEAPRGPEAAIDAGPDPLAVTTPDDDPEASGVSHSSRVQIGTGRSGIVSPSDVGSAVGAPEERSVRRLGGEPPAEEAVWSGGSHASDAGGPRADDEKPVDEWRDIVSAVRDDVPSESIGFGAFVGGSETVDPATADSFHGDSQGIDEAPGETIDVGALSANLPPFVATETIVTSGPRPKRTDGGLGQVAGVVIGGVLAIPVTLAILLYGFQRDPLRLTPNVPDGLRFLLPSRFRSAGADHRVDRAASGPGSLTLDQLPSSSPFEAGTGEAPPLPNTDAAAAQTAPVEEESPGASIDQVSAPADPGELTRGGLPPSPPSDPVDEVEIVVDPVLVDAGSAVGGRGEEAAEIDLAAVTEAIDTATIATDQLGAGGSGGDPTAREAALVGWYRALSLVALELARVERAAIESARPTSEAVGGFQALRDRLASERRDDLELLGGMWLSSEKRPTDGAILVATLGSVRPVGPWWGGSLSVGGESPRRLSFLAHRAPAAQPGEGVIVVGVLGDPGTIWVVEIAPLQVAGKVAGEVVDPGSH